MQKVLAFHEVAQVLDEIELEDAKKRLLHEHLSSNQTASFESYPESLLSSFDWYDVNSPSVDTHRILIYFDRDDFFIFCKEQDIKDKMQKPMEHENESNEQMLHHFLFILLARDMDRIDDHEDLIIEAENAALSGYHHGYMSKILEYRKEILRLKRYYTQLQMICDGLIDNENGLISEDGLVHFNILHNRVDRCHAAVLNLQDHVTQMREAYQAQIDIEQNELMKIFTLITALFLPLTLMVGWYGMNFTHMPELGSSWGYPVFIIVSGTVSVALLLYFKKKRWF